MGKFSKAMLAVSICAIVAASGSYVAAETDEECAAVGRIAEKVMERRQGGKSLQSTMDVVIPKDNDKVGPGFRKMIMDAYEVPFFNMQESKDRAIGEFRDQWQLTCMKG
ncbi:hypothetical protein [Rhizobium rhizogenes]|uniref:hypothetical protein n=1 Tax=Rhizobium rhizogenes TaxID=359 RepID=UPI0022C12B64|nr:hypothetical protein [Rhizobium rhizogenes]MCZ7484577.1 hypothetical protein [Rhizobium rhizogenes]